MYQQGNLVLGGKPPRVRRSSCACTECRRTLGREYWVVVYLDVPPDVGERSKTLRISHIGGNPTERFLPRNWTFERIP